MHEWVRQLAGRRFPKGRYSQGGQEGILMEIFRRIPTANAPPFCVEFGFNSDTLTGGTGSNVASLVLEHGWTALLLDGGFENPSINLRRELLTSSNVVNVLAKWGVPEQPDYISVDVDSTDLWLFRALLGHFRASVYSVEYNSNFPLELSVTCRDEPQPCFRGDRAYGASLRALAAVAQEHGYSLVAVEPRLDAFFARNDLIDDGSGRIAPPLSHWRPMTVLRTHALVLEEHRLGMFVDYGVWRTSGGDMDRALAAGRARCLSYLTAGAWLMRAARVRDRIGGLLAHVRRAGLA